MRGNFYYQRLGKTLIRARQKRQLSQEEVALLGDIDRTYFARIEEGKANPSVKVLKKICKALRVGLDKIFKNLIF